MFPLHLQQLCLPVSTIPPLLTSTLFTSLLGLCVLVCFRTWGDHSIYIYTVFYLLLRNHRFGHIFLSYCLSACDSVLICLFVLLKGKKRGGCTMGTPGPDTSVTIRGSRFSFLSSLQRHSQEVLHHCIMDKWAGRIKTQGENARIHSLVYFRLWKHTHTQRCFASRQLQLVSQTFLVSLCIWFDYFIVILYYIYIYCYIILLYLKQYLSVLWLHFLSQTHFVFLNAF